MKNKNFRNQIDSINIEEDGFSTRRLSKWLRKTRKGRNYCKLAWREWHQDDREDYTKQKDRWNRDPVNIARKRAKEVIY